MVYFDLGRSAPIGPGELVERVGQRGVVLDGDGSRRFRLVTHYWVSAADIDETIEAFREAMARCTPFLPEKWARH